MAAGPLVLLPGLDGTGLLFRPLLAALPESLKTMVVSYPVNEILDLDSLADLVARRLPDDAVLLAESFSGLVALTLLKRAPARVRGLIFVGAFAEPPRPYLLRLAPLSSRTAAMMRSVPAFLLRTYCLGSEATAAEIRLLREALAAVSPAVLAQRLALVAARHDFRKARHDLPVSYLRARADRLVPAVCARWFEQRFAGCRVQEIDGPHFLLQARPREAATAIAAALSD